MMKQKKANILETLQREKHWIAPIIKSELNVTLLEKNWYLLAVKVEKYTKVKGITLDSFLEGIKRRSHSEMSLFLNHETSWFRDRWVFDSLKENILPAVLGGLQNRPLRVWSAGCSSGQEMYSLVMMIHKCFPHIWNSELFFYATDVSEETLTVMRNCLYTPFELSRGLPPYYLKSYFEQEGSQYRLKSMIRDRVCVESHNLLDDWSLIPTMDLILMRNVLQYLSVESQDRIIRTLPSKLSHDGVLILGASDHIGLDMQKWKHHQNRLTSWFQVF
jgi:chemotaxis protein methyltransferase CheR